jgi:hypothetical protein
MLLVSLFVLLAARGGQAMSARHVFGSLDDDQRLQYNGVLNDHSIATAGSWEVHGVWTLSVKGNSGKADFSAAITMERADLWFVTTPNPPADPNSLAARNAHTHHISLNDGLVAPILNGFRVSGPVTLTGNGATPPFGTSSTIQVDITGGNLVAQSNINVTFFGDAVKHFGAQPYAGVVSGIKKIE